MVQAQDCKKDESARQCLQVWTLSNSQSAGTLFWFSFQSMAIWAKLKVQHWFETQNMTFSLNWPYSITGCKAWPDISLIGTMNINPCFILSYKSAPNMVILRIFQQFANVYTSEPTRPSLWMCQFIVPCEGPSFADNVHVLVPTGCSTVSGKPSFYTTSLVGFTFWCHFPWNI